MNDPRQHRHVRSVSADKLTYVCGCVNVIDAPTGALRCVSKCDGHRQAQRETKGLDHLYYEDLGTIRGGIPRCREYLAQLREAIGAFPERDDGNALEVGCGCSMYAPGLIWSGYLYSGLDPSEWAAEWTASTFDVPVVVGTIEGTALAPMAYDLVLCAHCLEHLDDAPGAIKTLAHSLRLGGELWIVIPDDTDPLNPDHQWFFNEATLTNAIRAAGLDITRMATRQYIEREKFLYCRARRGFAQ